MQDSTVAELQRELNELENDYRTRRDALQKKIAETLRREQAAALAQIQLLMVKYKIQPDELRFSGKGVAPKKTRTVAPKFRGPNGETWSGRGRQPLWLGADRENFRIKD